MTRIIGYLKRISNFSQARQEEAHRRHYHNPQDRVERSLANMAQVYQTADMLELESSRRREQLLNQAAATEKQGEICLNI